MMIFCCLGNLMFNRNGVGKCQTLCISIKNNHESCKSLKECYDVYDNKKTSNEDFMYYTTAQQCSQDALMNHTKDYDCLQTVGQTGGKN